MKPAQQAVEALRKAIGQLSLASALLPDVVGFKMNPDEVTLQWIMRTLEKLAERTAERAQQEETPPEPVRLCERCGEDHRKLGKTCCHRCGSLLGVDDETGACLGCG